METSHYLRSIARCWWLILLTVIAGGAGGYLVDQNTTAMYRSAIRVIVASNNGGSAIDEVTLQALAAQRASNFAHIAPTPPAIADAAEAAGYPGAAVAVTATSNGADPFIDITVEGTDPARAQAIATAYVQTLPGTVARLEAHPVLPVHLSILSPAQRPTDPFSPDPKRDIGLGLAAGLVLGVALALLREALNRTVRTSDELQQLTGLRVLGTVPRHLPKVPLPAVSDPRSARAEAYRQIRTTLLNAEVPLRTIAVTSAALGEGKTSVATNVAAVFSRAGHSVALVDADLRRPQVAKFFKLKGSVGLTEVLTGSVALEDALVTLDEGRLAILPSGRIPANPSEALGGVVMEQVLAQLAAEYDYVFVDTPPVLPVTDALVIAPKVDGVVLVARLGRTTRERITHAAATIERVNATILGVVPNQAGKGTDSDYRYPYRYTGKRREADVDPATVSAAGLRAPGSARAEPALEPERFFEPREAVGAVQFSQPLESPAREESRETADPLAMLEPAEPVQDWAPRHQPEAASQVVDLPKPVDPPVTEQPAPTADVPAIAEVPEPASHSAGTHTNGAIELGGQHQEIGDEWPDMLDDIGFWTSENPRDPADQ